VALKLTLTCAALPERGHRKRTGLRNVERKCLAPSTVAIGLREFSDARVANPRKFNTHLSASNTCVRTVTSSNIKFWPAERSGVNFATERAMS